MALVCVCALFVTVHFMFSHSAALFSVVVRARDKHSAICCCLIFQSRPHVLRQLCETRMERTIHRRNHKSSHCCLYKRTQKIQLFISQIQ